MNNFYSHFIELTTYLMDHLKQKSQSKNSLEKNVV